MTVTPGSNLKRLPGVRPEVYFRRLLELPLSPRCRQLLERALLEDGDLDRAAVWLGMSQPSVRKELQGLRALIIRDGLSETTLERLPT